MWAHLILMFLCTSAADDLLRAGRVGDKPIRRVLYMCHKPRDGHGVGLLPQMLNKDVIVPAKVGQVAYSFLEPSFADGFQPWQYDSDFDQWVLNHGLKSKLVAMRGALVEKEWTPAGTRLPVNATGFPTLIPPAEHMHEVANQLCFGAENVPCYEAVVAVACPNPEEPKMMALADRILQPGGTYYLGNMARGMATGVGGDPCELPPSSRGGFTLAPAGRLPQPLDLHYCTYEKITETAPTALSRASALTLAQSSVACWLCVLWLT